MTDCISLRSVQNHRPETKRKKPWMAWIRNGPTTLVVFSYSCNNLKGLHHFCITMWLEMTLCLYWLIGLLIINSICEIRCLKKYCLAQKITMITSLENADYRSVNYLKISFRLWIINLKKQSLPHALRYLSVLYLPDGSCSRNSLMKCSSSWM